ncbi:HAD family hydrolase [Actinomadura harenae]|uniref:HAD family hydrolase n=1 Tax=Actinomadura harenae TaxID=2483351 RepID=A0A3M2LTG4_9ACTN|nr:HAD family hydrolase [Actinomadura harenae]RMI39863.1 HAD family hydrolase [Actinomadura harenae]
MPEQQIKAVAFDYGGTISEARIDRVIGQKRLDPAAVAPLHRLHTMGIRLVLASNTLAHETRWPALQMAGVDDLFTVALLSDPLGVAKPDPMFYRLVLAAADCAPGELLFVGDNLRDDVTGPIGHEMRAALVRPDGLRGGEELPTGAHLIRHVGELPDLVAAPDVDGRDPAFRAPWT